MKFSWKSIAGFGAFSPSTLEICEQPTKKCKNKKWIKIVSYSDTHSIVTEKCPTGWFFVKDFYGHSGWVRKTHQMQYLEDNEPSYYSTPQAQLDYDLRLSLLNIDE